MKKSLKVLSKTLIGIGFILAYTIYVVCKWTTMSFGVGIEQIVFTMTAPLEGSDSNVLYSALSFCLPRIAVVILLYVLCALILNKIKLSLILTATIKKVNIKLNLSKILKVTVIEPPQFVRTAQKRHLW